MNDSLAVAVADFLAHKRALGRKYLTEEATLRLLLAFAGQHGVNELRQLTPLLLDEFVASRPRERARSFNHLVGILGCFLDWAVAQQRLEASPLRRTRRRETAQRLPFLFDAVQARQLLAAAAALPDNPRATGRGPTYHGIFVLGYGLGLRAAEACCLRFGDIDTDRQLLVVRGGKFGKSRLVPHARRPSKVNSGASGAVAPSTCRRSSWPARSLPMRGHRATSFLQVRIEEVTLARAKRYVARRPSRSEQSRASETDPLGPAT